MREEGCWLHHWATQFGSKLGWWEEFGIVFWNGAGAGFVHNPFVVSYTKKWFHIQIFLLYNTRKKRLLIGGALSGRKKKDVLQQ